MEQGYDIFCDGITVKYYADCECYENTNTDHCHDRYEITYLLSARGKYIIEGSEHSAVPGMLLLISPMSYHRVELDSDRVSEGYTIYFSRESLSSSVVGMLDRITAGGENHGLIFSQNLVSDHLSSCFERFSLALKFDECEKAAYMQAVLSEIVILLSATEGERIARSEDELGARVAEYINSNIDRSISLDRLARRFFVSKYYLCRAFKNYAGTSPHAYINQKRIIYAKQLIDSGMTASKAAERVGFGDYSAFYRAYTKIVGKSPTAD